MSFSIQLVKNHWYGVVAHAIAGCTWARNQVDNQFFTGVAGTIQVKDAGGVVIGSGNNVDRVLFNDGIVAFDWYSNLGEVYRLYPAAFNRVPDQGGLSANVAILDDHTVPNIQAMANGFLATPEGQATYPPGTPNSVYIVALYHNCLKRDPSTDEVNAWLAVMGPPTNASKGLVMVDFSDSPENQNTVNPAMYPGVVLTRSFFGI